MFPEIEKTVFSVQTLPSSTVKLLPVLILSICHAPALYLDHTFQIMGVCEVLLSLSLFPLDYVTLLKLATVLLVQVH